MGASRQTQRAQEHAQRRITRDDPHPSVPASGWKPAGIKYERSGLTYDDIAALLDGTIAREKALEAERDRLREERDAIARTAAKAGDVIEQVMTERDRLRAALEEVREYAWQWAGDPDEEPAVSSLVARKCIDILDRHHGFGGDQ